MKSVVFFLVVLFVPVKVFAKLDEAYMLSRIQTCFSQFDEAKAEGNLPKARYLKNACEKLTVAFRHETKEKKYIDVKVVNGQTVGTIKEEK